MASSDWIESAWQAGRKKAPGGDGFIDRAAQHQLGGAYARQQDSETRAAARFLIRHAPDPEEAAAALGLDLTAGDDPAGPLVQLAARGDTAGAREWLDSRSLTEMSAIRAALGALRRDR